MRAVGSLSKKSLGLDGSAPAAAPAAPAARDSSPALRVVNG
jgi:hypothetical protein